MPWVAWVGGVSWAGVAWYPAVVLAGDLLDLAGWYDAGFHEPGALVLYLCPGEFRGPSAAVGDVEPLPAEQVGGAADEGGVDNGRYVRHV